MPYRPLVYVVGDAVLDRYHRAPGYRRAQEDDVPVVPACPDRWSGESPGGAANVAANLLAQDCHVRLICPMGQDAEAARLVALLPPGVVRQSFAPGTTVKTRYYAGDRLVARVDADYDAVLPVEPRPTDEPPEAVVVTDYGRGAVTRESVAAWIERWPGTPVYGDPKKGRTRVWSTNRTGHRLAGFFINQDEIGDYAPVTSEWSADRVALAVVEEVLPLVNAAFVVVKRGPLGSVLVAPRPAFDVPTALAGPATPVPGGSHAFLEVPRLDPDPYRGPGDVQGAGDTYAAAAVAALCRGVAVADACLYASAAAGVAAALRGTTAVSRDSAAASLRRVGRAGRGVRPAVEAAGLARAMRALGLAVGYSNGCFDVRLHAGHLHTLAAAATGCDFLVVGVDSDARVARLKGAGRPVIPAAERARAVAALAGVGAAFVFEDLGDAVRAVRPHTIFKGGAYDPATMPETAIAAEWGGTVAHTGTVDCDSTTALVTRLFDRSAARSGACSVDPAVPTRTLNPSG